MEYSLQKLNKSSNLNSITVNQIINKLNLIGFEVDDIINEKTLTNQFIDNIKLLIKLPADREDLLNEKLFLIELSTVLVFELLTIWEKVKIKYSFLLNKKYSKYNNYKIYETREENLEIILFNLELINFKSFVSPLWIQNKLLNAGIKPLKNLDDFINLVNFEWGQNFNSFFIHNNDFTEKLISKYFLKKIETKEKYIDQFNNLINIEPGNVVILDQNKKLISILGQIGSLTSIMNLPSKKIFLQGVFYNNEKDLDSIIQFDKKVSLKYFRKIFLEMFKFSFQRLLTLLEINCSIDINPILYSIKGRNIELKSNKILKLRKKLFKSFLNLESYEKEIFNKNGIRIICETGSDLYCSIPNFRKDLKREIDLIEEYSRFIGYKNFNEIQPLSIQRLSKKRNSITFIKQYFLNSGFNEIITNPFIDSKKAKNNSILLTNPLNIEFTNLRTTSLFKLIEVFQNNLKLNFFLSNYFEIGRIFKKIDDKIVELDTISGIFQLERLKKSKIPNIEWFLAKGFLENFLTLFGYSDLKFEKNTRLLSLFHPVKSMIIKHNNFCLGTFGELNPNFDMVKNSKYSIYIFELNLTFLKEWRIKNKVKITSDLSKYLPVIKDISIIASKTTDFSLLRKVLKTSSIHIKNFEFFDIYFDEIVVDKIKIGIRFEFESYLITFTNEIIEQELEQIKQKLIASFNIIIP